MDLWTLPEALWVGERYIPINWEWRAVLGVLAILGEEAKPLWQRWFAAVDAFYAEPVPNRLLRPAVAQMEQFITQGRPAQPGPKLFDWQADAAEILSDLNRVAGRELRKESMHWWTFLGFFHAIGEGRFAELVALRQKLSRGEKLTDGEREFCRLYPHRVRLPQPPDPQREALEKMLAEH